MKKHLFLLLFLGILILGFILRFYKLDKIPLGLNQDESSIGYSAYSIIKTGKDEYGKSFPVYFKSFGDQKLPVYIYFTVISESIFGLNDLAVRFPSAFFGFLTIPVFYLFLKEITKDKKLSLTSMALLAVNPWHLHYSRSAYEVSISLFLFIFGAYLLIRSLTIKKPGFFLLGTICFILSLYSYNLTRLLSPLLYILILVFYKKELKRIKLSEIITTSVFSILLLFPFIATLFTDSGINSAKGTLIFSSSVVQAPLLEFRANLLNLPSFLVKLFFNTYLLTFWEYLRHMIAYLSVSFFFLSGDGHGNHGIGNVGQFYLFELPLIIIGLIKIEKEKYKWGIFLLLWALIVVLVAAVTREAPQATRSFFLIAPIEAISALGLFQLLNYLRLRSLKQKALLRTVGILFIFYNLVYYFTSYYVVFPATYAKEWRAADKKLSLYLKEKDNDYESIIIDNNSGYIYSSYLFYNSYPPSQFQSLVIRDKDDSEGFSRVASFGKISFLDITKDSNANLGKTLYVASQVNVPSDAKIIKIIYYPSRPVFYPVKQEVLSLIKEESAYVVFEKK